MKAIRYFLPILLLVSLLANTSCRSGKIPCPDIGTKKKFGFLRKKTNLTTAKESALGESVAYDKNGLVKKKKYKYLRNKPNRKKYK